MFTNTRSKSGHLRLKFSGLLFKKLFQFQSSIVKWILCSFINVPKMDLKSMEKL